MDRGSSEHRREVNEEKSVPELVAQLADQTSALARKEIELAKAELTVKGRTAGIGAGAFGGAGVFGFYALGALTAAAILALAEALEDGWLAALIVAAIYAAIAGALALFGKGKVEAATPPVPERAIATSREDIETAKSSFREARA